MVAVVSEGRTLAKRKGDKSPVGQPTFERIELQAPLGWTAMIDAAAAALGVSRSAYIRMALIRQMEADKKAKQGG